jgi:hypothetical protein
MIPWQSTSLYPERAGSPLSRFSVNFKFDKYILSTTSYSLLVLQLQLIRAVASLVDISQNPEALI